MDREEKETEQRSRGNLKDEEYYFLQEAVHQHRRGNVARVGRRLAMVLVTAVVFGAMASVTAWSVQNILNRRDENAHRENLLADASSQQPETQGDASDSTDSQMIAAYENYWKRVSDVGEQCNKAVVSVGKAHTESWYQRSETADQVQSGLLFQEKDNVLYVLTQATSLVEEDALEVAFCEDSRATAVLQAKDTELGLAVLCVEADTLSRSVRKQIDVMDFEKYASQTQLSLNDRVLIFGSPNGIVNSVIPGNVVNTRLSAEVLDGSLDLYATDIVYTSGGNGFVADIQGRVVGILTDQYQDITGKSNWAFVSVEDIAASVQKMAEGGQTCLSGHLWL